MLKKCQNGSFHFLDELMMFGANCSAVERTEAQNGFQSPDDSDAMPKLNQYLKAVFFFNSFEEISPDLADYMAPLLNSLSVNRFVPLFLAVMVAPISIKVHSVLTHQADFGFSPNFSWQ